MRDAASFVSFLYFISNQRSMYVYLRMHDETDRICMYILDSNTNANERASDRDNLQGSWKAGSSAQYM